MLNFYPFGCDEFDNDYLLQQLAKFIIESNQFSLKVKGIRDVKQASHIHEIQIPERLQKVAHRTLYGKQHIEV